jgi:single-strand DNA-binding protein
MNKVFLLGNLGAKPELTRFADKDAVLRLRVATNERFKNREGNWQERTDWHTVKVWGKSGEALYEMLDKGDKVMVEGQIRTRSYEKDGSTRYVTEVHAWNVHLTTPRDRSADIDVEVELPADLKLGVARRPDAHAANA